jgi:hypothetical protein
MDCKAMVKNRSRRGYKHGPGGNDRTTLPSSYIGLMATPNRRCDKYGGAQSIG